jgi:hypothetical protein
VREEFLLLVREHVPKVLADLEASVLPLFINLPNAFRMRTSVRKG